VTREQAFSVAWRALGRRERTEAELRRALAAKGVEPEDADAVLAELKAGGYVHDQAYARRFAEDRRHLDGWGSERIERRLRALGVESEHVAVALAERTAEEELGTAVALLARRFAAPLDGPRECERALGMLLRRGYELELAHDAVRRYASGAAERDCGSALAVLRSAQR
jgi:regulatory protein